jgi:hypothetical protein
MSTETRAHVKGDWVRDGVAIAIVTNRRGDGQGVVRQWIDAYREYDPREAISDHEDGGGDWLRLPEREARALYEALAEHFGHTGNDVRALRRDYEAERARVDRLIDYATASSEREGQR